MRASSAWWIGLLACCTVACGGGDRGTSSATARAAGSETVAPRATPRPTEVAAADAPAWDDRGQEHDSCPADLAGLEASVASIPDGGAIVLTAERDDVEALRARMRLFAKVHEQEQLALHPIAALPVRKPREGAISGTPEAATGPVQPKLAESPPAQRFADESALVHEASEIRVVDAPRGARLEIRLEEPARVEALRAELRRDAEQLASGTCPLALSIERG